MLEKNCTYFEELVNSADVDIKDFRQTLRLSVPQAASALGVSPSTFEAWEAGRRNPKKDFETIRNMMREHAACLITSSNPIFGKFDFSFVRNLFGISASELSNKVGVSVHTWRALEQGRRIPSNELLKKVEDLMARRVAELNAVTTAVVQPD